MAKEQRATKSAKRKVEPRARTNIPKPKKSALSSERVVDSGSDEDISESPKALKKSDIKSQTGKAPIPKKGAKTASTSAPSHMTQHAPARASSKSSSDSSGDDSSEESEEESDHEQQEMRPQNHVAKEAVNGTKRKVAQTSSSDETSERDASDDGVKSSAKRQKSSFEHDKVLVPHGEEGTKIGKDARVESDREERLVGGHSRAAARQPQEVFPAKAYIPPRGYTALEATQSESLLSATRNLSEKKIWHVTAPKSVPLQSIKKVTLDIVQGKAPAIEHEGIPYIFQQETTDDSSNTFAALPFFDGIKFVSSTVEMTLNLRHKIELPNISKRPALVASDSAATVEAAQSPLKVIRPQPNGLRIRYKPPGFGVGNPGTIGSESESADEADNANESAMVRPMEKPTKKRIPDLPITTDEQALLSRTDITRKDEKARKKEMKRLKREAKQRAGAEVQS